MAGTAVQQPRRGVMSIAPGENRNESELFGTGGIRHPKKFPEAVSMNCNETAVEGQWIFALNRK